MQRPSTQVPASPAGDTARDAEIEQLLRRMTPRQKIGQMVMIGLSGTTLDQNVRSAVRERACGGLMLYRANMRSEMQTRNLTRGAQKLAGASNQGIPLLLATDQEGGRVVTVRPGMMSGYTLPAAADLGTGSLAETEDAARRTAALLHRLGLNMNFAPVMDVLTEPSNPIIEGRSFGNTPEEVAVHGCAYIHTLQAAKIIATAKHFPGHGATKTDSHKELPSVDISFADWALIHLAPFTTAVRSAGVDAVMTAHVKYRFAEYPDAAASRGPATLSPYFITTVLRDTIGFQGIIVTDSLIMGAISRNYPWNKAVLSAVDAGADVLLVSHDNVRERAIFIVLENAVTAGRLRRERLDASVRRILRVKAKYGLLPPATAIATAPPLPGIARPADGSFPVAHPGGKVQ